MPTILVNPMNESIEEGRRPAPRLLTLRGATLGMLDISKPGGSVFLDHLERLLVERHGVARVVRKMKPTFAKPAPAAILDEFKAERCHAVVEALAD